MRILPWVAVLAGCAGASTHPFTPSDLNLWHEISDPRITADGAQVVYVDTIAGKSSLWIASTDGKTRRQFTAGWSPRWPEDGRRVAFLSGRSGTTQIFVDDRQLTRSDATPLALAWSPDGATIAFTARVREPLPNIAWAPPALIPQLRTSHTRLFLIPAAGGDPRPVEMGNLEPVGEPAWMPDGRSLLLALAPPVDPERPLEGPEIYLLRVADSMLRRLTNHPGADTAPVPSPDGSRIAWITREPAAQSYVTPKLWVANPDGSRARSLAGALDRDPRHPQWSSDSRTVYFLADDRGVSHVYAARNDGSVRQVTAARERLHGFAVADNGRAVTVRSPEELITFPVDLAARPVVLAAPNQSFLAEHDKGTVEGFTYASGNRTIEAWITKPAGFDPAKKYPLLLDIDDAPRRMCGGEFRLRTQILAAAGLVVLCANARGTPGYGEAFGNLIRSGFPGDDFDDLMAGVVAMTAKPYIDARRVSVIGGLLAAWAIGHTDRFHAAVAVRPVADFTLDIATAPDGLRRATAWMGAFPWADPDQYVKHSPIYFAQNFKTPTLVIAGEHDAAAEELYFALRARKVDCALVRTGDAVTELQAALAWIKK